MITIITGTPGTGKTAYVVNELMGIKDRNIFVDGIPELALDHQVAPGVDQWVTVNEDEQGVFSHQWNFPPNSIIIIDEAQRSFRPRAAGSKVPPYVAALETHRHAGLDFWFITQHPSLIEANVRRLCGRHIHVRNTALGRRLHEWSQVEDPESSAARAASVTRPYKLPKAAFSKYKSAETHTKNGKRLPLSFFVVILALVLVGFGGWYIYNKMQKKVEQANGNSYTNQPINSAPAQGVAGVTLLDPSEILVEFVPRIPGRPETAPAYDQLRRVVNMPVVVGCVITKSKCACQNQQGLDAGLDDLQCRQWVAAPQFDAYRLPPPPPLPEKPEHHKTDDQGAQPSQQVYPDHAAPPGRGAVGQPSPQMFGS